MWCLREGSHSEGRKKKQCRECKGGRRERGIECTFAAPTYVTWGSSALEGPGWGHYLPPEITCPDHSGLRDSRETWCPCDRQLPYWKQLHRRQQPQGWSSGRGFHNLCPSDEFQTLFMYIDVCVSWVSSDCKEAQPCKTSPECLSILFLLIIMECISPLMLDLGETKELKTKIPPQQVSSKAHDGGDEVRAGVKMTREDLAWLIYWLNYIEKRYIKQRYIFSLPSCWSKE